MNTQLPSLLLCNVISVALVAAGDRAALHPSRLVSTSPQLRFRSENAADELVRDIYEDPRNGPKQIPGG